MKHLRLFHNIFDAPAIIIQVKSGKHQQQVVLAYSQATSVEINKDVHISVYQGAVPLIKDAHIQVIAEHSTAMIVGDANTPGSISLLLTKNEESCTRPNIARIRFIHGCFGAPQVDVWITSQGEGPSQKTKLVTFKYRDVSTYFDLDTTKTNYIEINQSGSITSLYLSSPLKFVPGITYEAIVSGTLTNESIETGFHLNFLTNKGCIQV